MTLWKRIISAVAPQPTRISPEQHPSVATARPAPRPYSATERYLIALSIGRATGGAS